MLSQNLAYTGPILGFFCQVFTFDFLFECLEYARFGLKLCIHVCEGGEVVHFAKILARRLRGALSP